MTATPVREPTLRALVTVEVRRALARRTVRALVLVAVVAAVVMGIGVFANAEDVGGEPDDGLVVQPAPRPATASDTDDPAYLVNLWQDDGEGLLLIPGTLLPLGAAIAAASLLGAEWHAGTMTTLLTWAPRRLRVLGSKLGTAAALAALISLGLLVVFSLALLPTMLVKGSTQGADGAWAVGVAGVALRIAGVAGLAALLGGALAAIARSTGFAVGVALGYLAVVEPIMRGLKPAWVDWFLAENIGRFVTARPLSASMIDKSTAAAALLLLTYAAVAAAVAMWLFHRRDVAGSS